MKISFVIVAGRRRLAAALETACKFHNIQTRPRTFAAVVQRSLLAQNRLRRKRDIHLGQLACTLRVPRYSTCRRFQLSTRPRRKTRSPDSDLIVIACETNQNRWIAVARPRYSRFEFPLPGITFKAEFKAFDVISSQQRAAPEHVGIGSDPDTKISPWVLREARSGAIPKNSVRQKHNTICSGLLRVNTSLILEFWQTPRWD